MEAEGSSDHGSTSDELAGSDSGSTCVHSAGPPPPVTDVVLQCHRSPQDWDMEGERQLQRMATRGGKLRGIIIEFETISYAVSNKHPCSAVANSYLPRAHAQGGK